MNSQYGMLEDFIICAINDIDPFFTYPPRQSSKPTGLIFKSDNLSVRFEVYHTALNIEVSDTKDEFTRIMVNVNNVPNLMSYLAEKRNDVERKLVLESGFNEVEFDEINSDVTKILKAGKLNEQELKKHDSYPNIFLFNTNRNKNISLWFTQISDYNLGFQKIIISVEDLKTNDEKVGFNRVIPLHQICEFPFVESLAKIPDCEVADLNPNIKEIINNFSNSGCSKLSPIAQTIELNHELPSNTLSAKRIKI